MKSGGLKSYKCDTQKTQGAVNPKKNPKL